MFHRYLKLLVNTYFQWDTMHKDLTSYTRLIKGCKKSWFFPWKKITKDH